MKQDPFSLPDIPLGFSMALSQNGPAMAAFAGMEEFEREALLRRAREVQSRAEMRRLIDSIGTDAPIS